MNETEEPKVLWCGNLSEKVSDDILYELFLQVGPLEKIVIPKDKSGKQRTFAFITFKDACSVPYAMSVLEGTKLFNRTLQLQARTNRPANVSSSAVEGDSRTPGDSRVNNYEANQCFNSPDRRHDDSRVNNYEANQRFNSPDRRHDDYSAQTGRHTRQNEQIYDYGHGRALLGFNQFKNGSPYHNNNIEANIHSLLRQVYSMQSPGLNMYSSQIGASNYLGGTPDMKSHGGSKSHQKRHTLPQDYPYSSDTYRNKDRDRNRDHHRRPYDDRRH